MLFRRAAAVLFAATCALRPPAALAGQNLLRAGDKLAINVYNHPELSQTSVVNDARRVAVPLIGEVDGSNLTAAQLARRISARLDDYIPQVAVDVTVVSSEPTIFVDGGLVAVLPYAPGETLANAVTQIEAPPTQYASADNNTPSNQSLRDFAHGRVDLRRVGVMRDGKSLGTFDAVALRESGAPGIFLKPGDTLVLVNKPIRVTINGEVREPGTAYLGSTESLSDALTQVGGTLPTATSLVVLTRGASRDRVALGSSVFMDPAHDGDVIFVPRAPRIGVVGAVDKPGDVTLFGDASLVSAIYNAGGPAKNANLRNVVVVRNGKRESYDVVAAVHGDGSTPALADGDTVMVPVGHKVDYTSFWQALGSSASLLFALK